MKSIQTHIDIKATPERVWQILTDFSGYPNWNPFVVQIVGDVKVGSKLTVVLQAPDMKPATFQPTVIKVEPNKEFRWVGRLLVSALFEGEHIFTIETKENGTVRFLHSENFRGILVAFLGTLFKRTERGFNAMNDALRQHAESDDVKE